MPLYDNPDLPEEWVAQDPDTVYDPPIPVVDVTGSSDVVVTAAIPLPALAADLARAIELHRQSPANDAFGRSRISQPVTLFASSFEYDASPLVWQSILTAGGTATTLPNEAAVRMRVATVGDKVIRQTYRYFRYLPGKSQLVLMTGVIGGAIGNVDKKWGYFDDRNGLYFRQTSAGINTIGVRSFTSGVAEDIEVEQTAWNLDPMDGTGPSGVDLDLTLPFISVIDFEWLGMGRQRWGFNIDGMTYYVHENNWANRQGTGVYMTTANLPLRYEIEATGTPDAATADLYQVCSTVVSEGGSEAELHSRLRSVNNGASAITASTRRAILTIRPKATFGGLVNRAYIKPVDMQVSNTGSNGALIELVRGHALGGSPSFASAGATSTVEYDVAGTTVTGGEVLWSGYSASTATVKGLVGIALDDLSNTDIPLHLDHAGANPVLLSVVVTALSGSTTVLGSMTWKEVY